MAIVNGYTVQDLIDSLEMLTEKEKSLKAVFLLPDFTTYEIAPMECEASDFDNELIIALNKNGEIYK